MTAFLQAPAGSRARRSERFAVIVNFQSDSGSVAPTPGYENTPPLTFWHNSPAGAARRLAALINCKAKWVPKAVRCGKRYFIRDMETGREIALIAFRAEHKL